MNKIDALLTITANIVQLDTKYYSIRRQLLGLKLRRENINCIYQTNQGYYLDNIICEL